MIPTNGRRFLVQIYLLLVLQKTATAVAHCKEGNGLIKVNGFPLHLVEPATLRYKVVWCMHTEREGLPCPGLALSFLLTPQLEEPLLLLGKEKFEGVDIRVRVKGGGHVARIYGECCRVRRTTVRRWTW